MNNLNTNVLIDSLIEDAEPVKPIWSPQKRFIAWLLSSSIISTLIIVYYGPFRESFKLDLLNHPYFFLEVSLAIPLWSDFSLFCF